jgi:dTMP kinase
MLANELERRGFDVLTTHEPGGTALGQRLRAAILDPAESVDPLAEILIYAADRAQHVRTVVRPALEAGKIVLSDRFADSTIAFQGGGRGFSPELVKTVVELATGGLKPDLTLIFDLPVAECIARTMSRTDGGVHNDRLESENAEFHTRVRDAYLDLAAAEPERVRLVDASGKVDETHEKVLQLVESFFEKAGGGSQKPEARSQESEVRIQKTEYRRQKTEVRTQDSEYKN